MIFVRRHRRNFDEIVDESLMISMQTLKIKNDYNTVYSIDIAQTIL